MKSITFNYVHYLNVFILLLWNTFGGCSSRHIKLILVSSRRLEIIFITTLISNFDELFNNPEAIYSH